MTKTIYSTHYVDTRGQFTWANGRLHGLFQIKEEWEDDKISAYAWSCIPDSYQLPGLDDWPGDVVDYDTARHWPHP